MSNNRYITNNIKDKTPTIKAIGFDFGGVIFPDLDVPVSGKIARRLGISSEIATQILDEIWPRLCIGQTTEAELWQKLLEKTKNPMLPDELKLFYRRLLVPNQEMVLLIRKLSERYSLFAVTNTAKEWLDYQLDNYDLRKYFSLIVDSTEARSRKPAPEFFEYLLAQLKKAGLLSNDCIFIDDRENNTQTASQYGFQTIIFQTVNGLKKQLASFNVK